MNRNNNDNNKNSTAILLANLKAQFQVDLTSYKQAVADYMTVLEKESDTNPCDSYKSDSIGLSQKCYNKIWKDQGCTTQPQDVNSPYPKTLTIEGLVHDSYLWATINDDVHRQGCYGTSTTFTPHTSPTYPNSSEYMIIGVGTNGFLYSKQSLDESDTWQLVQTDDANGSLRSVCTGIDGKTLYCTNSNNQIYYKSSWDYHTWTLFNTGGGLFKGVAACPDGTLLGVGLDNVLYQIRSDGSYTNVKTNPADGESLISVVVAPDGSVIVCNGAGNVYKKNSYQNLPSQGWQGQNACCITASTIAPDGTFIGIGMSSSLWTKDNYTDLNTHWKGPYGSSCCVVSITTVSKNPKMVSIQSQTYWGKGQLGTQGVNTNVTTVDDCVALCSTTTGCSGATFNPIDHGQPMCWLRTGDSDIGPGLYNDYAIVPETKKYLEAMKSINTKLNDTNQQIMDLTMGGQGEYAGLTGQSSNNHIELTQNYEVLQKEREKINNMLTKFDDLDESQVDTSLSTTQHYYTFILLSVIAVAIGFVLYSFSGAASQPASIFPTIQQGGKRSAGFIFFAIILILIIVVVLFIKSGKLLQ